MTRTLRNASSCTLRLALLAPIALPLLLADAAAADPDDCRGRNPLHCKAGETEAEPPAASDPDVILAPPGGCAGRNPRYCRETEPESPETAPESAGSDTERRRRQPRNPGNPSRNPNRNPNRGGGS